MNQIKKVIVRISAILVLLLIGIFVVGCSEEEPSMREPVALTDPTQLAIEAKSFATYELPPGYEEVLVQYLQVSKALYIRSPEMRGETTLYQVFILMQLKDDSSLSDRKANQILEDNINSSLEADGKEMEVVEETTITVNGQTVDFTIFEGTNTKGYEIRQAISGVVDVSGGRTALAFLGPKEGWDQEGIDTFIGSIE